MKTFNITVSIPGAGSRIVQLEAPNTQAARQFAEARYAGCKIFAVNVING